MPILSKRALGALLLLAASAAHAQYVWIAPNGTRQYSDRPPPSGTPASKIIKAPGKAAPDPAAADAVEPASSAGAKPADAKGPPTLAEREAAFRERSKARDDMASKQREAADMKRRQDEYCSSAREAHAQLASGMRVSRVGADGQKTYMTDEEKAVRAESANRALAECRQAAG